MKIKHVLNYFKSTKITTTSRFE